MVYSARAVTFCSCFAAFWREFENPDKPFWQGLVNQKQQQHALLVFVIQFKVIINILFFEYIFHNSLCMDKTFIIFGQIGLS